jgi:hypothetical protein
MKQFNNSFATIKLRETLVENKVTFTIDDQKIDDLFLSKFNGDFEYSEDGSYTLDQDIYEKFVDYVESSGLDSNNIRVQGDVEEQGNVTGGGEAYNASLHASEKKRNPFTEDELSGYKKLKGFRAGHTKDTGGFQYSDLWGVNEGFEVGDKAKVTMKGNVNHNKIGEIVDVTEDGKYFTLQFKNNTKAIYHQSDITIPAKVKDFQDKPSLPLDEEDLQEASIPDNIKSFAKRKQILPLVMQVARWAEKAGENIVGGTAIGKNYSTLVLDITREGGEIHINTEDETIEVNGNLVDNYNGFITALQPEEQDDDEDKYDWYKDEYINENHSNSNAQELERVENLLSVAHQKNDYSVMTAYENRIKLLKFIVLLEKKLGKQLPTLQFGEYFSDYVKDNFGYTGKIKRNAYGAVVNLKDVATHVLGDKALNENYHRFKKETVTRSKEQQMHEAMKLVRKKLYEAEKVIDYVKTMKEELGLQEYKSHTNKLMEKLQVSISEIYKKYKSIK